jgi:hypothetical protein
MVAPITAVSRSTADPWRVAFWSRRYKGDLFSGKGRTWLAAQPLEDDERTTINGWLAELDRLAVDLARVDTSLAQIGLGDDHVRRLMTITGINLTVAIGLTAAIGDITRFASSEKLVSYGLGRGCHTGTSPRLLHPHQSTARTAGRRSRDRAQDRGSRLALAHQGRGLRLRTAGAPPGQAEADGDESRNGVEARRQHTGASKGLQHQAPARCRACLRRAGRGCLRSICRGLERTAENKAVGRNQVRGRRK